MAPATRGIDVAVRSAFLLVSERDEQVIVTRFTREDDARTEAARLLDDEGADSARVVAVADLPEILTRADARQLEPSTPRQGALPLDTAAGWPDGADGPDPFEPE